MLVSKFLVPTRNTVFNVVCTMDRTGSSNDDVSDTFKYMKSERIGQHLPFYFTARAEFEQARGNTSKCRDILSQGKRCPPATTIAQEHEKKYARYIANISHRKDPSSTGSASPLLNVSNDDATATVVVGTAQVQTVPQTPSSSQDTSTVAPGSARVRGSAVKPAARPFRRVQGGGNIGRPQRVSKPPPVTATSTQDPLKHSTADTTTTTTIASGEGAQKSTAPTAATDETTHVFFGKVSAKEERVMRKVENEIGDSGNTTVRMTTYNTQPAVTKPPRVKRDAATLESEGSARAAAPAPESVAAKRPRKSDESNGPAHQHLENHTRQSANSVRSTTRKPLGVLLSSPSATTGGTTAAVPARANISTRAPGPPEPQTPATVRMRAAVAETPATATVVSMRHVAPPPASVTKPLDMTADTVVSFKRPITTPKTAHKMRSARHYDDKQEQELREQQQQLQRELQQQPKPAQSTARDTRDVVYVAGRQYQKLQKIGKGGSSCVYKVIGPNHEILALKEVDLSSADLAAIQGYENEISLLEKLQGSSYIIKLHGWERKPDAKVIHIVMECGDADLSTVLRNRKKAGKQLDENYLRLYWQEMLEAVNTIHATHVVHSDLKPANFLFVEGVLKLIDFGIATQVQDDQTSAFRESAVGTLNYMAPEAISNQATLPSASKKHNTALKIGPPADVWSLGCILYSMTHGKTPFQHLNPLQKLQAIVNVDYQIEFPPINNTALTDVLRLCLQRDPKQRPTIAQLLTHKFLNPKSVATPIKTPQRERPGPLGLSQEQLQAILAQLPQHSVAESPGALSRRIFGQLAQGCARINVGAVGATATILRAPPPAPPPPPPMGSSPPPAPRGGAPRTAAQLSTARKALAPLPTTTTGARAGGGGTLQQLDSNILARGIQALRSVSVSRMYPCIESGLATPS